MGSYWIRVGSNPIADVFIRGKFGNRHTGRMPCDDRGRDHDDMSTSYRTGRIASNNQKLGKGKEGSPCRTFKGTMVLLAY